MRHQKVTGSDIARKLGISQSTVSRGLSNSSTVRPETRAAILREAALQGYSPNAIARGLSTSETKLIGVVLSDVANPFFLELLEYLHFELAKLGRKILLLSAGSSREVAQEIAGLVEFRVDGILFVAPSINSQVDLQCQVAGIPHVLIGRGSDSLAGSAVDSDNRAGGRIAADLFGAGGHCDIGYVVGSEDSPACIDRERGFREGLRSYGVTTVRRFLGRPTHDDGYRIGKMLLHEQHGRPSALFCSNDLLAMGVMDSARDAGVSVPHQLSVIGYDDIPMAAWSPYRLTTIRQHRRQLASAAVQLLMARIKAGDLAAEHVLVGPELVLRDSFKPLAVARASEAS